MACPDCIHRALTLAALAPAIERLSPLSRESPLELLALEEAPLRRALGVAAPGGLRPWMQRVTGTAICRHDHHGLEEEEEEEEEEEVSAPYPSHFHSCAPLPPCSSRAAPSERLRELLRLPTVAILGERHHTHYAHQITFALARDLALSGVTLLSGLHQGLDSIAHHGALSAGGHSVAVTGCAPERAYPRQLDHLHRRIASPGAVVSEFPPGFHPPRRWCLIASRRILAALADVVVVVEARERSSAVFCAFVAADLGREVAVVPGRVSDPGGVGTLSLLHDGAHPVSCARDVLELLPARFDRGDKSSVCPIG